MTFGERLQQLRRKAGMSQDALAEKLEVSRQAVSKWERDEAMPETDKVIRIAQLFGVSLDALLLGREEPEQPRQEPQREEQPPHYQPPRYQTSAYADRAERFIRRHGYKAGYIMSAVGAVICVLSLVIYLVWPSIGSAFFGGFTDSFGSLDPWGGNGVTIEGDIPVGMEDVLMEELLGSGSYGSAGGFWNSAMNSMESSMNSALRAQAAIFLIPMIPGLILVGAGLFIIVKGKKMAQEAI